MSVDLTQTIGQNVQAAQQYGTSALENKIKNADFTEAKDDELLEACKSFESYFVEQVIKEVEKTVKSDDGDSYASQMTDYFKDSVIQNISDKIVDQSGTSLAKSLYEQMKRNYGITDAELQPDSAAAAVSAAERTAGANASEETEEIITEPAE